MDVGADNFRFTLEDQNGRKLPPQTYRPPCTTELHLDSLDRYLPSMLRTNLTQPFTNFPNNQNVAKLVGPSYLNSSQGSTGCVIQTNRPLAYGYFSRVALTEFSLSWRAPNVQAGYNNTFFVATGTSPGIITNNRSFTIPQGFYTFTQYLEQIQAGLNAIPEITGTTVNVVDARHQTYEIVLGQNYAAFQFGGGPTGENSQVIVGRAYRMAGISREMLGYTPEVNTTGQPTAPPTLWNRATSGVVNLLPTDYVDIVSASLSNFKDSKDGNSTVASPAAVIGRVWLTDDFTYSSTYGSAGGAPTLTTPVGDASIKGANPFSVLKKWAHPNWSQWSPNQTVNVVDIRLLDMWGQQVMWTSEYPTEWSATLTLTE